MRVHKGKPSSKIVQSPQQTQAASSSMHLLQLQSIAGNRAVMQYVRNKMAQHLPSHNNQPIQKNSKVSIKQPDDGTASDQVPDLPRDMVTNITNAKKESNRQKVIDEMLQYLNGKGAVDDINRTQVVYVHSDQTACAVTELVGTEDDDPVKITFFKGAFMSPSILYSVFRHELIHVGQRLQVPDEESADMNDDFMHENIYDHDVGVLTRDSLQLPLQEIETHVWEIDHASETGIGMDYLNETIQYLIGYIDQVIAAIKDETTLPDKSYEYWKGYIYNAEFAIDNCIAIDHDLWNKKDELSGAIEAREQLIFKKSTQR